VKTGKANARSNCWSNGSRSGTNSLRASVAGTRVRRQLFEDALHRVAAEQPSRGNVVEHARIGQRSVVAGAQRPRAAVERAERPRDPPAQR
jgi:hypothetical protein